MTVPISDLRIGNKILLPTSTQNVLGEHAVTIHTFNYLVDTGISSRPIPISDVLLKERCEFDLKLFRQPFNVTRATQGYVLQYGSVKILLTGLHHLQNVYYAIFGVELKIK